MKKRRTYSEEAEKLVKAIDIAIEAYKKFGAPGSTNEQTVEIIESYQDYKQMALNPEPQYKSIASLKYLIEAVFTPFQEGTGECVEYFWEQLAANELDYVREENRLQKILARGKISGRIEYDYIVDFIVIAQQEELISEIEADKLYDMLENYEARVKS